MIASNRQDVCDIGSSTFLSEIDPRIQKIVLKLKSSPSVPVETLLGSDFAIEQLLEVRKVIFKSAKEKYCNGIRQDGAETTSDCATQKLVSTCNFTLTSRRSPTTAADDIKELCLYMFCHRSSFPKSCLSSVSQPKPKQPSKLPLQTSSTDAMIPAPTPFHQSLLP